MTPIWSSVERFGVDGGEKMKDDLIDIGYDFEMSNIIRTGDIILDLDFKINHEKDGGFI
jgi:hypothetical protein